MTLCRRKMSGENDLTQEVLEKNSQNYIDEASEKKDDILQIRFYFTSMENLKIVLKLWKSLDENFLVGLITQTVLHQLNLLTSSCIL